MREGRIGPRCWRKLNCDGGFVVTVPDMAQPFLDRDLRIKPIDVFIDPPQPQRRAIITHGHGDHARLGHGAVLATPDTVAIMKTRYGEDAADSFQTLD